MKKLILLISVLGFCLVSNVFAAESKSIHWKNYTKATYEQALSQHHRVILFAKSETCHWCHKMEQTTFVKSSVVQLINRNYEPLVVDVDKNYELADELGIMDLPTVLIIDTYGHVAQTLTGYIGPEAMQKALAEGVKHAS